jgi:hypothetical protein
VPDKAEEHDQRADEKRVERVAASNPLEQLDRRHLRLHRRLLLSTEEACMALARTIATHAPELAGGEERACCLGCHERQVGVGGSQR